MKKIIVYMAILGLTYASSAYALQKGNARPGETISINPGKTTQVYVREKFGEPYLIKQIGGKKCWFYESGDDSVIFVQFNDKGVVEDNYGTTKSSIPYIKTKSLEQVLKKEKDDADKDARRKHNLSTYGKPDQETYDREGETWYYNISKNPTEVKNVSKVKRKAVRFDGMGNFVKESITDELLMEWTVSKEESDKFKKDLMDTALNKSDAIDKNETYKLARSQTNMALKELVADNASIAYKQGSDFMDTKQYDKAIPCFKRAIDIDHKLAMAHLGLAFAYQNTNQRDLSIQSYEKYIELDPTYMAAYLNLSAEYMLKNDIYKAYKCLKKAQTYNQNDETVNKAIKALETKYGTALTISEQVEKDKSHSQVVQSGNLIFVGPSYYKEGQIPITPTEQKIFDEYNSLLKELESRKAPREEGEKLLYEKCLSLTKKYNISNENLTYLLLKMGCREIPPDTYQPPVEKH